MKANVHCRAVGQLLLATGLTLFTTQFAFSQDPSVPRGTLGVDRDLVRVGTRSNLDWNIEYPSAIEDIVEVDPKGTIKPKKDLKMRVRVLGVAFQSGRTLLPIDAYWSFNGGGWTNFFYGTGPTVNPAKVLIEKTVKKNDTIDFGARGANDARGNSWNPFNHTRQNTAYVTVLGKGAITPTYTPAYNQDSINGFLRPYIDRQGRVTIGERDLIILWESSTARPGTTYFDMQDLVVLVSFE